MTKTLRAILTGLVLSAFLFVTSAVVAPTDACAAGGLTGIWKATVLKKGNERVKLDDYLLVLTFNKDKTWSAKTKAGDREQTTNGTYAVAGADVTLSSGGKPHPMRVIIQGNTLVISPKDDPNLRFVALRVQ